MAIAFLIGRIIVALYYIKSGVDHFRNLNIMAGYAASKVVELDRAGAVVWEYKPADGARPWRAVRR